MKVNLVTFYFDGGTAKVVTDGGDLYVDRRLSVKGTDSENAVWLGYPGSEGAVLANDKKTELRQSLRAFVMRTEKLRYKDAIIKVINDLAE